MNAFFGFFLSVTFKMSDPVLLPVALLAGFLLYKDARKAAFAGALAGLVVLSVAHMLTSSMQRPFSLMHYPSGMVAGMILAWVACSMRRAFLKFRNKKKR